MWSHPFIYTDSTTDKGISAKMQFIWPFLSVNIFSKILLTVCPVFVSTWLYSWGWWAVPPTTQRLMGLAWEWMVEEPEQLRFLQHQYCDIHSDVNFISSCKWCVKVARSNAKDSHWKFTRTFLKEKMHFLIFCVSILIFKTLKIIMAKKLSSGTKVYWRKF